MDQRILAASGPTAAYNLPSKETQNSCNYDKKMADSDSRVPQEFIPKDPSEYTNRDKELVSLDASLRSILVESMDSNMRHQIKDCVSAKHMWETIEAIVEGTEDKNGLNFLIS
ncbi:hypothetical protein AgCh_039566 [Apium graveolens]